MEVGGEVRRGKVAPDTAITFALSLAMVVLGLFFSLAPSTVEPNTTGWYLIHGLGTLALIVGSGCTVEYWHKIQHELYPSR